MYGGGACIHQSLPEPSGENLHKGGEQVGVGVKRRIKRKGAVAGEGEIVPSNGIHQNKDNSPTKKHQKTREKHSKKDT